MALLLIPNADLDLVFIMTAFTSPGMGWREVGVEDTNSMVLVFYDEACPDSDE